MDALSQIIGVFNSLFIDRFPARPTEFSTGGPPHLEPIHRPDRGRY